MKPDSKKPKRGERVYSFMFYEHNALMNKRRNFMKWSSIVSLGLFLGISSIPAVGTAAQFGRQGDRREGSERVCFYKDANYGGTEQCYRAGDEVTSLSGRGAGGVFSSIRVYGRVHVTVFDEDGFRGRSTDFTSDVPNLQLRAASGGHTWNDRIQSFRVVADDGRPGLGPAPAPAPGPVGRLPEPRQPRNGVCVYERAQFQGRSECWESGEEVRDLARLHDWGDRISSIRVFGNGRALIYNNRDFRGESMSVERDIPDLSRVRMRGNQAWNNQISSLQIEGAGGGPGRGRGRDRDR